MKCPFCNYTDSKVLDSRATENSSIRRRRECLKCLRRFTTYETVETAPILVVKTDGTRQTFDANKIKMGIIKACEKRPVSITKIEEMVSDIEKQINNSLAQEVSSGQIGEMVTQKLKVVDEVAYVRFASVYRKFKDIGTFVSFIQEHSGQPNGGGVTPQAGSGGVTPQAGSDDSD